MSLSASKTELNEHASNSSSYSVGSCLSAAHEHNGRSIRNQGPRSRYLHDEYGRCLLLHGCSVSGLSKLPTNPNGFTHLNDGFFEHKTVDFIGRPFPLDEACVLDSAKSDSMNR